MTDPISTILEELIGADPTFQGRETQLRALLGKLTAGRPQTAMHPVFKAALKEQLLTTSVLPPPSFGMVGFRSTRVIYGIGTVALLAILLVIARPDRPTQVALSPASDLPFAAGPAATPISEEGDMKMLTSARTAMTMQLTSTAFQEGQPIPARYTCDENSQVPPLSWSGVPPDAVSLALVLHDPDAPREGGFTHWVVYDIPTNTTDIGGTNGSNGTGKTGYVGPCPPTGSHHYVFTLYALDTKLGLGEGIDRAALLAAMDGHIISTAELVGTYQKK